MVKSIGNTFILNALKNIPNIMKIIFQLLITISFQLSMFGQNSFELKIMKSPNQLPIGIFEINDGYILNEYSGSEQNDSFTTKLYKLDFCGNIIDYFQIKDSIYRYSIDKIVPYANDCYLGFGYQKTANDSTAKFTVIEMNSEFDVISEKFWSTEARDLSLNNIGYMDDNYYVFGTGLNMKNNITNIYAYKLNRSLKLIASNVYSDKMSKGNKMSFRLMPNNFAHIMRLFVLGYHQQTNTHGQILIIDTTLNIVDIKGIPEGVKNPCDAKYWDEEKYLLTGRKPIYNSNPQDEDLAILKMQNNDTLKKLMKYGSIDTIDYTGNYSNLDFIDTNIVFFGGTKNFDLGTIWSKSNSWFVLNKLDNNLDLQWQKFYGGDTYYTLWNLIATIDGGCMMAGTFYDYNVPENSRDIYIIKVNEDGLIVGTGEEPGGIKIQDAIVYPNPGNEFLKVQSGPQVNGALFELFDLSGNLVLSSTLNERVKTINTSDIPYGTYPYRVTYQNKIVANGKWVKQ